MNDDPVANKCVVQFEGVDWENLEALRKKEGFRTYKAAVNFAVLVTLGINARAPAGKTGHIKG